MIDESKPIAMTGHIPEKTTSNRRHPNVMIGKEIFQPLEPTRWIVDGLQICPGRPSIVVGYGASGKTLFVQSLAIQVAAGVKAFGLWNTVKSHVLYIDLDQGRNATLRRFQRLARGHGISPDDLSGLEFLPQATDIAIATEDGAKRFAEVVAGVDLVVIDAVKGLTVGADENESSIRTHLDLLTRISEEQSISFLLLHHEGKGRPEDRRMNARGSSAIFDAAGSVFRLKAGDEEGRPRLLQQHKGSAEACGPMQQDMRVDIEDVEVGGNYMPGIKVVVSAEEKPLSPHEQSVVDAVNRTRLRSTQQLGMEISLRKEEVVRTVNDLKRSGVLAKDQDGFFVLTRKARKATDN